MSYHKYYFLGAVCLALLGSCSKKGDPASATKTQPIVKEVIHADGEVVKLYSGDPNGPNIVILGDGFIKKDLVNGGTYDSKVKEMLDYFFSIEPFKTYKGYFNVYKVYAESEVRGAHNSYNSLATDTKFNAYFSETSGRSLVIGNYTAMVNYVQKAIPYTKTHLTAVIVNDERYGGTGGTVSVVSTDEYGKYTFVHEAGHTFGGLGDEYVDEPIISFFPIDRALSYPNVDMTDDPKTIKWARYYNIPGYDRLIGAFAGAYYRPRGFYRPEKESIMVNSASPNFNAPSREAIVRRIDQVLGIPFDMTDFLKKDVYNPLNIPLKAGQNILPPSGDIVSGDKRLKEALIQQNISIDKDR